MSWKVTVVEAFDLPDAWYRCLKKCFEEGYEYTVQRGSFVGHKRKELDNTVIVVRKPDNPPLVPDVPQGVPPPTSMDYVNKYLRYLYTSYKQDEEYTYGERLTAVQLSQTDKIEGSRIRQVNQIDKVIKMLRETPETNQACVEVGMPTDILLKDPPCLRLLDFRVRYGKLHMFCYFRSWDLWAGFPANLAALEMLKQYMAKEIDVENGTINAYSKGLHLYDYTWEWAKQVLYPKMERRKWFKP